MNPIKLSVAIITYNEEKNIERCLKSIEPIADEILVVDSFSNDETENICRNYNVRFIPNKFEGHIEQKNFALKTAQNDIVLSLDADEALDEEAIAFIQKLKENWIEASYEFRRKNNYCGKWLKHSGWYPDKKVRLLNRNKAKWTGTNPHDKLTSEESIKDAGGHILHYTIKNQTEHLRQINYFTDISSQALFTRGKKSSIALIIVSPIFKFIRDYILKLGFLDGFEGFVIAANSAHAKFQKYVKLYYLNKTK